jgi:hypothetical protein
MLSCFLLLFPVAKDQRQTVEISAPGWKKMVETLGLQSLISTWKLEVSRKRRCTSV